MEENKRVIEETSDEQVKENAPEQLEEAELACQQETMEECKKIDHQILAKMYEERVEALNKIAELEKRVESIRNKLMNQEPTPAQIREQIASEHRVKEDVHPKPLIDEQDQLEWEERMNDRLNQIKETGTKLTTNATEQLDQFKHKATDSIQTFNEKMEEDPQTTIKQVLAAILMLIGLVTVIRNIFKS
ncbi:hypothetical protein [Allobaculum stercoricanis]|uniref:hypothetical protein n=1 Tax=Allobaculum stercoricanis TaxID=174709 RepID=UPI002942E61F|nr:hypothetical protein [Allobaculum stercoricanis]